MELHSEPLLQQLYESFRRDYPEVRACFMDIAARLRVLKCAISISLPLQVVFREPPRPGMLCLEDVRRSPYFFS